MLDDTENRPLWKYKKKRLEHEQMRYSMLEVAGNLAGDVHLDLLGSGPGVIAQVSEHDRLAFSRDDVAQCGQYAGDGALALHRSVAVTPNAKIAADQQSATVHVRVCQPSDGRRPLTGEEG